MDFSHKPSAKDAQSKVTSPDQDSSPTTEDMDAELVQRIQRAPATLSPREVLHLQRTIGNQAVLRALNAQKLPPARIVQSAPPRLVQRKLGNGTVNKIVKYITDKFTLHPDNTLPQQQDQRKLELEENYGWLVEAFGSENAKVTPEHLDQVTTALGKKLKLTYSYSIVEEAPEVVDEGAPFNSLAEDQENGLYTVTYTEGAKIRYRSAENPFADEYSEGKSVDDAVEEAIVGLDLTGSISFPHTRHDFQPSTKKINLQVQLGGSKGLYRNKKGDTSSTLVVVDDTLWNNLLRASAPRLKKIVQAAHRYSFTNVAKVELTAPG